MIWHGKNSITIVQWRHIEHIERDRVSNHWRLDCLRSRLFRRRSKKTSKLHVTGLCEGNPPVTGEFPSQGASNMDFFPFDDVIIIIVFQIKLSGGHSKQDFSLFNRLSIDNTIDTDGYGSMWWKVNMWVFFHADNATFRERARVRMYTKLWWTPRYSYIIHTKLFRVYLKPEILHEYMILYVWCMISSV